MVNKPFDWMVNLESEVEMGPGYWPHFFKTNVEKVFFGKISEKIFTYKELENLINLKPICYINRFYPTIKTDPTLLLKYFWDKESFWGMSNIQKMIKESTCYITESSRANKKLNNIAKWLEDTFDKPTDCHIYFSLHKTKNKSHDKHKDKHHNLIAVSEGTMAIEVENRNQTLKPGDFAWVPAGIYHRIIPISEKRISCSFPVAINFRSNEYDTREWIEI